jgi:chemotaxis protein MotB
MERVVSKKLKPKQREKHISSLRHDAVGVRMSLAASSLFKQGSDRINESSRQSLDEIARILKASNRRLIIEGHTDNVPIQTARFPSNWDLASARATRIVRYLIDRHGVEPGRLVAMSYADQKPLADNSTKAGRAKNRRIEVLIVSE